MSASHCTPNLNLTAADKVPAQHCRVTHVVFRWATECALSTIRYHCARRGTTLGATTAFGPYGVHFRRQVDATFRRVFLHYSNLEVVETFDKGEKKWEDNVAQVNSTQPLSPVDRPIDLRTLARLGLRGPTEICPTRRCDWRAMHATLTSLALYFG